MIGTRNDTLEDELQQKHKHVAVLLFTSLGEKSSVNQPRSLLLQLT